MDMRDVIARGAAGRPSPVGEPAARRNLPLACPFCGTDPPLASQIAGRFIVGCESDDCPVNPQVSAAKLSDAWAKWNRRA